MAELKTLPTQQSATSFLDTIEPESKRKDGYVLLDLFKKVTGEEPVMWGESIVGFGKYHYKSERSRQEGDWPLVAYSPRKQNLSLYIMAGNKDNPLLKKLGKHKASVGCLYLNSLADVDVDVLSELIKESFRYTKEMYKVK